MILEEALLHIAWKRGPDRGFELCALEIQTSGHVICGTVLRKAGSIKHYDVSNPGIIFRSDESYDRTVKSSAIFNGEVAYIESDCRQARLIRGSLWKYVQDAVECGAVRG